MKIHSVGVLSLGLISAIMYAGIGLVVGFMLAALVLFGAAIPHPAGAAAPSPFFAILAVVFFPIFDGLVGFIGGIISALLFNFAAGITGGLEIETGR